MRVELLFFDGCPSYEALLPRVRTLLSDLRPDAEVELRRVVSPAAAEAERFLGSPTVPVDGVDVEREAEGREDFGLKCRLYRTEEGLSPTPPEAWLRAALCEGRTA